MFHLNICVALVGHRTSGIQSVDTMLCQIFVSFYVYIKSRLFGELNGSYFRNKAQYSVSIIIFCSDLLHFN